MTAARIRRVLCIGGVTLALLAAGVAAIDIRVAGKVEGRVFESVEDVPERPVVLDYIKAYRERYGQEPATFGGDAYGALMIAVEALKKAGTDREKLRDAIEQTRGWVGTQGVVNMSPTDHIGLSIESLHIVEIRNGQWVPGS